ncbi:hypothetical protein CALCODRAFT_490758 [Calocera cornea HHB12733]|uniref:F-box domain-containing protein n=1 Tax=Calocera cornea HHB12733 TaxID=1353952 RepID=A0A165JHH7_9BASI|nr:hypothetical protein CALCODRAFT_490758 [Calocera cornea HHB12733]
MSDLLHDVFRPPAGELEALRLASSPPRSSTAAPALVAEPPSAPRTELRVNGERVRSPKSTSPERGTDGGESSEDEELVGVVSGSATPVRLSRPGSPTRLGGASMRRAPGPLLISASKTDPFRRLNTELVIRILSQLGPKDFARCSRVCKKWCNSQAANFVWFRHTRNAALPGSAPMPMVGSTTPTWTKRESKQNWRREYALLLARQRDEPPPSLPPFSRGSSRPSSRAGERSPGSASGYHTPKEAKEEIWALEAQTRERPNKVEMREAYKELGGRKARTKGSGGWEKGAIRNRTAYGEEGFGDDSF